MASISITSLTTSNTTPTITGGATLDRSRGESIDVVVNYVTYSLFDGNLGLDENVTPNKWILQIDEPLDYGVYDVEAYIVDSDGRYSVSDTTTGELTIEPLAADLAKPAETLAEKVSKMNQLLGAMNLLSAAMGSSVGGPHPVTNDDTSTHLKGRGKDEAGKDSENKDYKKKKLKKIPVPRAIENKATKSGGAGKIDPLAGALGIGVAPDGEVKLPVTKDDVIGAINEAAAVEPPIAPVFPSSSAPVVNGNASGGILV